MIEKNRWSLWIQVVLTMTAVFFLSLFLMSVARSQNPQNINKNGQDESVFTAVKRNNQSRMLKLIKEGADVNIIDQKGQTPLTLSLQLDSMNAFNALMSSKATYSDFPNRFGETPLMIAAIRGNLEAVTRLIRSGAAINRAGWSPLHYAATGAGDDQVAIVELILAKGADINARSPNGTTPLMMAADNGSVQVVQTLLDAGANTALVNDQNMTAATFAENSDRAPLAQRIKNFKNR